MRQLLLFQITISSAACAIALFVSYIGNALSMTLPQLFAITLILDAWVVLALLDHLLLELDR